MEELKRAIIVAAGEGKRLRPVSLETPKPLVRVNGTRLIDTEINALKQNGIHEIIIVAGYKKEQFHEEFWDLIHNKESHMRTYGNLYRKYKSLNLKTREFYYLYLTILENTTAFSSWKDKLLNIPSDELKSIQSISALNEKLEEYE